jgi:hypothetical protein
MVVLQEDPKKLDQFGQILLHGKGYDRWFDKSFTLCIGSNGRVSHEGMKFLYNKMYSQKKEVKKNMSSMLMCSLGTCSSLSVPLIVQQGSWTAVVS